MKLVIIIYFYLIYHFALNNVLIKNFYFFSLFSPYKVDNDCHFDGACNYLIIN